MRGGTKCGAALGMGAPGPFVTILRLFQPPQQLSRPEPFPGQQFPHHPVGNAAEVSLIRDFGNQPRQFPPLPALRPRLPSAIFAPSLSKG